MRLIHGIAYFLLLLLHLSSSSSSSFTSPSHHFSFSSYSPLLSWCIFRRSHQEIVYPDADIEVTNGTQLIRLR
nr:unnamed protein product [Spirometra erinaceieuropaei]